MGAITALLPMPEGLYLVCGNDFLHLSESGWERLLSVSGHCSKLVPDGEGGIWLATHDGLLGWSAFASATYLETRTAPEQIAAPDASSEICFGNLVQCLAADGDSAIWAGTAWGAQIR